MHAMEHRATIRNTWLREREDWDRKGLVARFFIGHRALSLEYTPVFAEHRGPRDPCERAPDAVADEAFAAVQPQLRAEAAQFKDLVFLPLPDSAEQRGRRALLFFEYAWLLYDFECAAPVPAALALAWVHTAVSMQPRAPTCPLSASRRTRRRLRRLSRSLSSAVAHCSLHPVRCHSPYAARADESAQLA